MMRAVRASDFATFRGNLTLWLLGLSVLLFQAWLWYFGYPADAEVVVLGGLARVGVALIGKVVAFVLGWLLAVYTFNDFNKIMVNFFRPLRLVEVSEMRAFFSAPATLILAALLTAGVVDLITANVAVKVTPEYEVVLALPHGSDGFLVSSEGAIRSEMSVLPGKTALLVLQGRREASQLLLVRDQYNLVTLDALLFVRGRPLNKPERRDLRIEQLPKDLTDGRIIPTLYGMQPRKAGLFAIRITGPLQYAEREIPAPVHLGKGGVLEGYFQPGEPVACPERTQTAADGFFQELCDKRQIFGLWTGFPTYEEEAGPVVYHGLGPYGVEVHFRTGQIEDPNGVFPTREAVKLIARELVRGAVVPARQEGP